MAYERMTPGSPRRFDGGHRDSFSHKSPRGSCDQDGYPRNEFSGPDSPISQVNVQGSIVVVQSVLSFSYQSSSQSF